MLDVLREHPSPRLAPLPRGDPARGGRGPQGAGRGLDHRGAGGGDKGRVVQEFRNRCPDALLPWIDAAVVLAGDNTFFPPLLGTGGNDGGSTSPPTSTSACWTSSAHRSRRGHGRLPAPGTCSPVPRPSSSPVPPSASSTRQRRRAGIIAVRRGRLAGQPVGLRPARRGRAAVRGQRRSPEPARRGPRLRCRSPSRAPPTAPPAARRARNHAARCGRRSGRGSSRCRRSGSCSPRPGPRGADALPGARSTSTRRPAPWAWPRGSSEFTRYGLQRRNGLAFAAVPLDRIAVRERPEVRLAADVEDWVSPDQHGRRVLGRRGGCAPLRDRSPEYARDGGALPARPDARGAHHP